MNKKAFTLTEMMIVLIIISGLMMIILPNVSKTKSSVDVTTCDAYIKVVESQVQLYILDKKVNPVSLDTLVTEAYIDTVSCPSGETLELDTQTLEVRRMVVTPV